MPYNTVFVKGYPTRKEAPAGGAIMPGHLIKMNAAGNVIAHNAAAGNAQKAFAFEYELTGKDIDTPYANGDNVLYGVSRSGHEVYALVAAGAGAIVIGDALESAGDGTLRKVATAAATGDTGRNSVVGYAMEALDNSAGAEMARLLIEVA